MIEKKHLKAKKILIKSGWIENYYFVRKVMEGNLHTTNVRHETKTREWGWEVLDKKLCFLCAKYCKLKKYLQEITFPYFDEISRRHEQILDEIIANKIKDEDSKEANNCN